MNILLDRFSSSGVLAKRNDRLSSLLPTVPRFVIEPAGITILFLVGLAPAIASGDGDRLREVLPELATVLVVLLRITSPLQTVFRNVNKLRGGLPEVKDALELLRMRPSRLSLGDPGVPSSDGVMPNRLIELNNVNFSYQGSDRPILENVNLSIPVGSRIALVGSTGGENNYCPYFAGSLHAFDRVVCCLMVCLSLRRKCRHGRQIVHSFPKIFACLMQVLEKMLPFARTLNQSMIMKSGLLWRLLSFLNLQHRCPMACTQCAAKMELSCLVVSVSAWHWPALFIERPSLWFWMKPQVLWTTKPSMM